MRHSIKSMMLGGAILFGLSMCLTSCDPYLDDVLGHWERPTNNAGGGSTTGGVTSITLSQTTLNNNLGDDAVTLTATVEPADAPDKSLTWSSDKETVAKVADGVVTFKGPGTAIIKATANDGSGVEATCTVTVTLPGLLTGKFTVNGDATNNQVQFSKGNLCYTSGLWSFFNEQFGHYSGYDADSWDKFGWSISTNTFGKSTSTNNDDYSGDFVDWGTNAISNGGKTPNCGWRTLTSAEWTYLFKTRSATTVNSVANARFAKAKLLDAHYGVILFPDSYTHPDGVALPTGINQTDATSWDANKYVPTDWIKMQAAGCVFLPVAGYRSGTSVLGATSDGKYWSSTAVDATQAYIVSFDNNYMNSPGYGTRSTGHSVRLVYDVK